MSAPSADEAPPSLPWRDALKVFFFDGTGLCIFYKRLDQGTFRVPDAPREEQVSFALPPERAWYALIVEDQRGRRAYTDPIWVSAPRALFRQQAPRP